MHILQVLRLRARIGTPTTLPRCQRSSEKSLLANAPLFLQPSTRPQTHLDTSPICTYIHAQRHPNRHQTQAFLLAAMKMHWAVRTLLAPGQGPQRDPRLVLKAVQGAISYMVSLVRSRWVGVWGGGSGRGGGAAGRFVFGRWLRGAWLCRGVRGGEGSCLGFACF